MEALEGLGARMGSDYSIAWHCITRVIHRLSRSYPRTQLIIGGMQELSSEAHCTLITLDNYESPLNFGNCIRHFSSLCLLMICA